MINLALTYPVIIRISPVVRKMAETPYPGGDRWVRSTSSDVRRRQEEVRAEEDKWIWAPRVGWWENHATWWASHDSWSARNSGWQIAEAENEEIIRMEEGSGVGNLEHQLSVEAEENLKISEQEEGSGVGNLEHQLRVEAEDSRRINEQEEVGIGRSRSVHYADAEVGNLHYEIHHDAGRGGANLSRFDAAFAAWQASQDEAYESWQASRRLIALTVMDEYAVRVETAFEAWQQRQYDRLLLYYQLGWESKVLLVAVRMGHFLDNLDDFGRCQMMQLGISWWREVCVFPRIFVNETSLNYMKVIQSDRLGALQPSTPLDKGLTTLLPIGHHILDGKLVHVS